MKLTRLALAVAALPLAVTAAPSLDHESSLKLSDTVITANRSAQSKEDTTAAVTVFTREDIDRLQPVNVADLLNRVPGVQVQQSGGQGSVTGISIRGTKTAQSVVLVDGVRIGSVTLGGANGALDFLNIEQIERIEVIRGSRSAMYGADAIGGIIQIFTRRGESHGLHARVHAAAGSKSNWKRSLGLSGGNDNTRFNISSSLDELNRFDRTTRSDHYSADKDIYRNKSIALSLSHSFSDRFQVGASALDQHGKSAFDTVSDSWYSMPYFDFATRSASIFSEGNITAQWHSRLELGYSENKLTGKDKLPSAPYDINSYRENYAWLNNIQLAEKHSLIAGADYSKDKLRTDVNTTYKKDDRWNQAFFAQHQYRGKLFGTELGWRHDKNQAFGNHTTWNAAGRLFVNSNNELVLSYAEGFRAPTFIELYSPWGDGNPDLKPEKSRTLELHWNSQLSEQTSLQASLYRTQLRNQIASAWPAPNENISKARINGIEATLQHKLLGADGSLNLALVDSRDRDSGHQQARVAKRTISYDLDKQLGVFSVGGTWRAQNHSYNDPSNKQRIGGFATLDLRASWQASSELGFGLRLGNIFDKKYSRALYDYQGTTFGYREDRATIQISATWTPRLL